MYNATHLEHFLFPEYDQEGKLDIKYINDGKLNREYLINKIKPYIGDLGNSSYVAIRMLENINNGDNIKNYYSVFEYLMPTFVEIGTDIAKEKIRIDYAKSEPYLKRPCYTYEHSEIVYNRNTFFGLDFLYET